MHVEGPFVPLSRGDSPFTIVNEIVDHRLVRLLFPAQTPFTGDEILRFVEKGKYENRRARSKQADGG